MVLYFVGAGIHDYKDISLKAIEILKKCDVVYFETYTCLYEGREKLEELVGKNFILSDRELVEQKAEETILKDAKIKDTAFVVIGDSFSATTHTDLMLRAKNLDIKVEIINSSSVFTGIGITGLQIYKFGKTTSIPFSTNSFKPQTHYDVLKTNQKMGLHTLFLLDLKPEENKFMTVNEAIQSLLEIENERKEKVFSNKIFCVGCARLGSKKPTIISGDAKDLLTQEFGKPVHCLIVPGNLHFSEEEILNIYKAHTKYENI